MVFYLIMYFSLKGKIIYIKKDYIVIEVNDIGFKIYVSKNNEYQLGEIYKVYLYQVIKEGESYLVGFNSIDEKSVFMMLISVKGIGPKMALNILSSVTHESLMNAIRSNNITFLTKIPGIGHRAAAQILLDLRGTFHIENNSNSEQYEKARLVLHSLKFTYKEIDAVLADVFVEDGSVEQIVKEALKKLEKTHA